MCRLITWKILCVQKDANCCPFARSAAFTGVSAMRRILLLLSVLLLCLSSTAEAGWLRNDDPKFSTSTCLCFQLTSGKKRRMRIKKARLISQRPRIDRFRAGIKVATGGNVADSVTHFKRAIQCAAVSRAADAQTAVPCMRCAGWIRRTASTSTIWASA